MISECIQYILFPITEIVLIIFIVMCVYFSIKTKSIYFIFDPKSREQKILKYIFAFIVLLVILSIIMAVYSR